MFKLRYGYLISGIITGSILLFSFLGSFPDGKLHIIFCSVGEGDAAYIQFPDGKDMVVDGGPDEKIIHCLSRHMPFWDRTIDIVLLTHPQKDHLQGLLSVVARYRVGYFLKSDITSSSDGYTALMRKVNEKRISVRKVARGESVTLSGSTLSFLWPSSAQIAYMNPQGGDGNVLGIASSGNLNDGSLVFGLRYGTFDVLFPGDADSHVDHYYTGDQLADGHLEVLKVPHHGSKTGMTESFIQWLRPAVAVISVGKNSYGHPSDEAISLLQKAGAAVHRTDREGDIEVVSDGTHWELR